MLPSSSDNDEFVICQLCILDVTGQIYRDIIRNCTKDRHNTEFIIRLIDTRGFIFLIEEETKRYEINISHIFHFNFRVCFARGLNNTIFINVNR